ncbi:hypothetical protein ALP97_02550 [Pseudomonas salomonii]|uniref:Uncharacterized protein n=1 Tax=Pseudomonas salomonii TaxID=191391 RepID=A0A3M4QHX0_9PSED|nr:hypothetical protein ALP97_02550 [Pseudomonas salomonii]
MSMMAKVMVLIVRKRIEHEQAAKESQHSVKSLRFKGVPMQEFMLKLGEVSMH